MFFMFLDVCICGLLIYFSFTFDSEEKINSFRKFVSILGYKILGNRKEITPKSMQNMLEQLKEKDEYNIISSLLLRSMQKAVYDKKNIGHFGLASKCYTHFTSPIRRYPDLTVHRLLRKYLFENKLDEKTINYYDNKLDDITTHSSERERAAVECEREVDDMKKAEYMMKQAWDTMDTDGLNYGSVYMRLGDMYFEGIGTAKNDDKAYECYQRAERGFYEQMRHGSHYNKKDLQHVNERLAELKAILTESLPKLDWI